MSFVLGLPSAQNVHEAVEGSGEWPNVYSECSALALHTTSPVRLSSESQPLVTLPARIGQHSPQGTGIVPDPVPLDTTKFFMSAESMVEPAFLQGSSVAWNGEAFTPLERLPESGERSSTIYPLATHEESELLWGDFVEENGLDARTTHYHSSSFPPHEHAGGFQSAEPHALVAEPELEQQVLDEGAHGETCDTSAFDGLELSHSVDPKLTPRLTSRSEASGFCDDVDSDVGPAGQSTSVMSNSETESIAEGSTGSVTATSGGEEEDSAVSPAELNRRGGIRPPILPPRQEKLELAARLGFRPLDYDDLTDHQLKSQYMECLQRYAIVLMDRLRGIGETPFPLRRVKEPYFITPLSIMTMLHAKEMEVIDLEENLKELEYEVSLVRLDELQWLIDLLQVQELA
ncbi:hypothetical protein CVT26_005069 [Gymnopilus dilepis]|uniref:Uncharacterized protein n=1 Tax=Gymnopilus dilepis TaxID=231916 RepID=A0A409W882_9AGAR|nr:hypothetical protein CVT26_005069 [Gymnopilus dilepis]